jgi:hypothetical protein
MGVWGTNRCRARAGKSARRPGEIPAKAFADPDPFRQLTYASALEAKRAIAQHLGRVLATLPAEQLETINIVATTTLNKLEVLGQVRACVAHPSDELPDAE